jgi:hypothetical protein
VMRMRKRDDVKRRLEDACLYIHFLAMVDGRFREDVILISESSLNEVCIESFACHFHSSRLQTR